MMKAPKLDLRDIPLSKIQGRKPRADQGALSLLAESIEVLGLYSPPWVVRERGGYRLIAGASRLAVARKEGLDSVSCLVCPFDPDTSRARLAFIDENLMRLEMSQADKNEMWIARAAITAELRPETTLRGKRAAAGQLGGVRSGQTRRGEANPKTGIASPRPDSHARAQQEAVHRKAHASPEVWGLFKDGQLRQSQVDALVTLPPETQKVVALEVVGKGVVETKEVVRAASAAPEGPARLVAALADSLKRVSHLGDNLSLQISESTRLIDALPSISLGGLGAWALLQQATALEPKVREFAVLLRSRAERERNDDDRSGNGTAQGIRSES